MAGEFGPEGGINSPVRLDPWKSKGVTMMPIHREDRWGTAVREVSVKERGYVVDNEEQQGDGSNDSSSNISSSTSSNNRLDGRWDGTSSFPFDRGKTGRLHRHSPGMFVRV